MNGDPSTLDAIKASQLSFDVIMALFSRRVSAGLPHLLSLVSPLAGDPLHNRAACTQPCNVNTHSRANCSPGAQLCEQWGHGCVNKGARLCASARLCTGSPVFTVPSTVCSGAQHRWRQRLEWGRSPWRPLVGLQSLYPLFKPSHSLSREDRTPADFILIFRWVAERLDSRWRHQI